MEISMKSSMPIVLVVALLLAADEPKQGTKDSPAPEGWSTAIVGSGIPTGQEASEYAAEVDHEVTHGGRAAMSLRSIVAEPATFRSLTQFVKADTYRGKRVRLAGYLKTRDVAAWCGLWLRVDGTSQMLAFDNMHSRALKGTNDWTRHEVVLDVPEAAMRLAFGSVLAKAGQVWADDLTLDVVDPKEIKTTQPPRPAQPERKYAERASNLDFEAAGADGANSVPGWSIIMSGALDASEYTAGVDREVTHGGQAAMSMRSLVVKPTGFRPVTQVVKADSYRGKRVRLAGYLKTRDVAGWCGLWFRVDGPDGVLAFDNMQSRAVKGTNDWTRYEVVLDVPETALGLAFGSLLVGTGQVWADDLTLDVVDPNEIRSTDRELENRRKRASELTEALAKMPDGPRNLDFER
jgi:hypothetical protein